MIANNFQHRVRRTAVQGIGAKADHSVLRKDSTGLGFWATVVALDVGLGWAQAGLGGAASAVATLAVVLLLVGWYLFGKENVVEYFRALEHAARTRTGP